ncbi:MAG: hypothetical protein RIK87_06505 [Fuerstiella sp.]
MSEAPDYFNSAAARSWVGASDPGELLSIRLTDLRRMRMLVGSVSGLLKAALAFLGTLLVWVWMDLVLDLSPELRLTAWLTAFGMLVILFVRTYRRTFAAARDRHLAQELDAAAGTGGEIRSGLDLSDMGRGDAAPDSSELSAQLARIAVRRASVLVHEVPDQNVAPLTPAFNSAAALGGFLVVLLIAILIGPRMAWTEVKRFFNPYGDHPPYSQYAFSITTDRSEVLYGEDLQIEATVGGPTVDQVQLVLVPPAAGRTARLDKVEPLDVLPMFPDPGGAWHASIANITEPFDFFLRIRRARSEIHAVSVITVPEIRDVRVEITAPLYTGLSVYRGPVPADGIEGLTGTEVRLTVSSNRPLSGGELRYINATEQQILKLASETDPHRVTGDFVINESGRIELQVMDEAGQPSTESYSIPLRQLIDQSPMVRMMQPKATSFATPTAQLPIAVAAEDDFGIRRCQLYRSLNNSRFLPTDLEVSEGTPRRLQTGTVLPLADYELQPGDEIRVFARVEDNDPHGPDAPIGKGAESDVVSVRIISQEDFDRVQQQKDGMKTMMNRYQQAQRRLENLAEKMRQLAEQLKQTSPESELAGELRDQMQQLAEQMQQEADAIQRLSEKPLPLELDQELAPQLKEMAERLRDMAGQISETAQQPNATNQDALEQIQQQMEALQQEQQQHRQQAMEPLEHLARVLPLKQAESEFGQLTQRQRQLAERLQSLKNQDAETDPAMKARMRELEEEQHRVRDQLTDLLDRIEEHADNLPEDPELDELRNSAREFAKAVRECQAAGEMASAEGALSEFDGSTGHAAADRAATLLEQFLSQCEGMGQQCENGLPKFSPGLGQSMANTLNQLAPGMKPGTGSNPGGTGMGPAGSGGHSSQVATMNNVGLYGGDPQFDPANTTMGESNSDNVGGVFSDPFGNNRDGDGVGFTAGQSGPAFGGADWGVPVQYRRQAGRYLQGLAEDLQE